MFVRLALVLIALLAPLHAVAQTLVPANSIDSNPRLIEELLTIRALADVAGQGGQVVPLWASADGRLLAIVAQTQATGAPTLPRSPSFGGVSDLRIIDATSLFSAGLRWQIGRGARADLLVGRYGFEPSPFDISAWQGDRTARAPVLGSLGLGWTPSAGNRMDFSFGLSWLDAGDQHASALDVVPEFMATDGTGFALLSISGMSPHRIDHANFLNARANWQLDGGQGLDLSAGVGRFELAPSWYGIPGASIDATQASLGLGISTGSLRGSIVGRVISIEDPSLAGTRRWSGLDLGVSWRTPWRGEVSVGAQNLWSAPLDPGPARESDAAQARMPYVQYRQDL